MGIPYDVHAKAVDAGERLARETHHLQQRIELLEEFVRVWDALVSGSVIMQKYLRINAELGPAVTKARATIGEVPKK